MHKISTSSLAKERRIVPAKLFEDLQSSGYIIRNGESWDLTDFGKKAGGELQKSNKYGDYIVWPTDLIIKTGFTTTAIKTHQSNKSLNATTIGEYFKTSSQRLNLILSELGLIEKDITGWRITKLGRTIGGSEHIHDVSGAHYVLWNEQIITYPRLLEVFSHELNSNNSSNITETNDIISSKDTNVGFREKFEAKHRTQDGHYVRSKAEMIIDNLLYQYGLVHAYERKLPIEEDVYSDFYIPPGNNRPQGVYIEYWGLENDEKYLERKKKKLQIYKNNELPLIELNDEDIQNLDDVLPRKLLQYKIKVY